jgi:penicillin amidase
MTALRCLILCSLLFLAAAAPANPTRTALTVPGLEAPARILVDRWGVPHIYAGTHYDAFFVQGFNAARDRLWQIDTWRRRGLGRLAEVFGPAYVEQDQAARLMLYRGDMYPEWLAYGADAKVIAEAFTAGINAYIDLIDAEPDRLPPEFTLLDYRPARWQPEDVVRIRSHGLWRNVTAEVQRARIACEHGLPAAAAWKVLEPAWQTQIPEGLDPCTIPDDVLDLYLLAKAPVRFNELRVPELVNSAAGASAVRDPEHRAALIADARARDLDRSLGSNNWVVAPSRTGTGRALIANDPHRAHDVPSLRYVAHLIAPGLNVIGAGEPGLPGISIGHNGTIAFGLTIFGIDQEDLFVYEKTRNGYQYQGRVEPFTEIVESIPVRGAAPREVRLRFTRHGPVLKEDRHRAFALAAAWLEPGMAPYFGSVDYMRATDWRTFKSALNRWGAPAENQVYADIHGNIGYKPAGRFPRRTHWDGLLPVPGDGRYEWQGHFDMDALPVEFNPTRGFTGTANSMNLPPGFPINERRVGFEWAAPWRYQRLWEALEAPAAHGVEQALALQRDYLSTAARAAVAALASDPTASDAAETDVTETDAAATNMPEPDVTVAHAALELLTSWDFRMTADSAAALLFAQWFHRDLPAAFAEAVVPGAGAALAPLDTLTLVQMLSEPKFAPAARRALITSWETLVAAHGEDPSTWRWGSVHRIRFRHPLLDHAPPDLAERLRYPDYPRGGTADTLNSTGFDERSFDVVSGASFRMVVDVGNWDAARMTNAPGQSGDPRSPFYANLLQGWAEEKSFPMLYSDSVVAEHVVEEILLTPADATPAPR